MLHIVCYIKLIKLIKINKCQFLNFFQRTVTMIIKIDLINHTHLVLKYLNFRVNLKILCHYDKILPKICILDNVNLFYDCENHKK